MTPSRAFCFTAEENYGKPQSCRQLMLGSEIYVDLGALSWVASIDMFGQFRC